MPIIRSATIDDVPAILGFIRALADYEELAGKVVADEQKLRSSLFGPRPFAEVLLGEDEGCLAGFAVFFHNYSTFLARPGLYLEDLFVLPSMRRRGLGRLFFQKLAQIAVERDCGRVDWSVLEWNKPAFGFYESLGARCLDDWRLMRLEGNGILRLAQELPDSTDPPG
jgi:GNAT superfamily N-acetyltransferase